jgi:CBS domain-containing protein
MKVQNIMTRDVACCAPDTTLGRAALTMREMDTGILPVLENDRIVGVITDRDIALALAERDRRPSEAQVAGAMSRGALTCRAEDGIAKALATMRSRRVRRLPVVDIFGQVVGMLSMNDVLLHTQPAGDGQAVAYEDTVETLQRISEHRYPVPAPQPDDVTELARCP